MVSIKVRFPYVKFSIILLFAQTKRGMRRRSGPGGPPATPVAVGGSEKTATPLSVAVTARRKDSGLHAGEPPSPIPAPQLSARGSPSPAPDDHLEQNELAMDDNREGDSGKQQVEKFRSLVTKNDLVELERTGKKTIPSKARMEGVLSMLGGCVEFSQITQRRAKAQSRRVSNLQSCVLFLWQRWTAQALQMS